MVIFIELVQYAKNLGGKSRKNLAEHHSMVSYISQSAVGNVSGYRCVSDCKSRGREFDPGPVPYFRGD